ncbi:MAG: metal-dependent transcriptional regulator [Bacillota bacterium]|nr:metal-dependent transcriptional regulator [Bacillota bacterium]
MRIQESGEDYLETILLLKLRNGHVRSTDIANELGYAKPSISRAVGILTQEGYITVGEKGYIAFTEKGQLKANEIYERHRLITEYLTLTLGIDRETADKDACRIEHVISSETFDGIKSFVLGKQNYTGAL